MGRPLTRAEAAATLRRGREIEQFLSLADGQVVYLVVSPYADDEYRLTRHVVHDEGTDGFADISEFAPVDEEEYVGEGALVATFADAQHAVLAADEHGGTPDGWVNQGMAATDYAAAKQRG